MLKNSTQPAGGGNVMYPGKVPGKVKYTFAFGALGKDMIYGMIATFSMIYFTDIIKVAPAFIGIMFFSAKIWDAFNDLFMGMLVDNTRSRFGKFIPWLTVGTLINAFVFIILFTDFHLSGIGLCVFAAVAYVLWGMTYTIMDIPYWSIVPNLTSDPHEREKVSVLPRIFASIGQSLIIAGFGVQIIKGLGGGYTGYHRFALIIAATFIFTIAVTVINLPKKQVGKKAEKVSFKDIFSIIKRNDQLRWAVALILLYNVGIQLIMGVATYYFAYVCNNSSMLSAFMISASIAEVVGLIIFPKVTKMLSRKKAFLMACILPAIGLLILLLTGIFAPQNIVLTVIAGVIVKTGTGLELGCATVFLADVVDYGEYKLGIRNEGVVFSLQTLIVKLTAAFTSLSIGFALDLTGYVPNQIQSLATQNSIRVLMCVIPAVGMLLAYVVYRRKYKLNDAYMKKVVSAISSPKTELTSEKTTEEESVAKTRFENIVDTLKAKVFANSTVAPMPYLLHSEHAICRRQRTFLACIRSGRRSPYFLHLAEPRSAETIPITSMAVFWLPLLIWTSLPLWHFTTSM